MKHCTKSLNTNTPAVAGAHHDLLTNHDDIRCLSEYHKHCSLHHCHTKITACSHSSPEAEFQDIHISGQHQMDSGAFSLPANLFITQITKIHWVSRKS